MFKTDIIQKCIKGNRKSQLRLYNKYCDAMLNIAFRYVKQRDLAEDVTQEAFIKAFKNLHKYDGSSTFGAWLKRIVINQSIDTIRKKADVLRLDDHTAFELEAEDWQVDENVNVTQVKQCISELSEKYALVLKLYLMEGYDHEEISEILNISENASRTQLHRGKIRLKAELKKMDYERFA
ncbi:MAG: RNA polymerase sigma factor [Psychroflexus sp.]